MIDTLLGIIAPHSCYGCGEIGTVLCDNCRNDIICEPYSRCIFCLRLSSQGALCRVCAEKNNLEAVWCVGERRATLRSLVDAYKFDRAKAGGVALAQLLHEVTPMLPSDFVVSAIPTAPSHIRARGYDHSELIAKEFARLRNLPYRPLLGRTTAHTQHFLTRQERFLQARDAFRLRGFAECVFLIDDIVTTGATLEAALRLLADGGVQKIHVGVIARQPLDETDDL